MPWRPEEGVKSPGVGVTGVCEQPDVGSSNQILYKGSTCF